MDPFDDRASVRWTWLLLLSGAVGLGYQVVWMRRLGLLLGGSATASAFTVGVFMGGLALGAVFSSRLPGGRSAVVGYAVLEALAASWALIFPWVLALGLQLGLGHGQGRWLLATALLLPPTTALGATWPLLARNAGTALASKLYAANTTGGVVGVLGLTFLLMPMMGIRGAEIACALGGLTVAALAVGLPVPRGPDLPSPARALGIGARWVVLACTLTGFAALGLEVAWMRLAAVALGSTVQTMGLVLATFLAMMALGAWLGRRWPADPELGLAAGAGALGVLALAGGLLWGVLPYGLAGLYAVGGPEALLPGSALIAAVAMGGAPAASGLAFSCAVRCLEGRLDRSASWLYAGNTLGSIAGALLGGLWAVPALELRGAVVLFAASSALAAALVERRARWVLAVALLGLAVPGWDARLYAVGVHLRISDFADISPRAVRKFADEGWELLSYDHGPTGAVAVGRSLRTGNVWLSINGKVDASTGDDMPTQELSGILPVRIARNPRDVLVVGLASGVTAGAALREDGVEHLTVLELEPAVVEASHHFDHVNGRPLEDPRTTLVIDDARAWLQATDRRFDVIVSEPSNPWITGVSSLFTHEYWRTARSRLNPGGVMLQWVQLYGMGPDEMRGIVRTFQDVFPDTWLFETIAGSDVLLIGALDGSLPSDLPLAPTLGPQGVARLGGLGWLNTDDRPRVEWNAPRWLHYATAAQNTRLIEEASER